MDAGPFIDEPGKLFAWLERVGRHKRLVLPLRICRGESPLIPLGASFLGHGSTGPGLRLDEGALGIPLADRLREAFAERGHVDLWIEARWGALVSPTAFGGEVSSCEGPWLVAVMGVLDPAPALDPRRVWFEES